MRCWKQGLGEGQRPKEGSKGGQGRQKGAAIREKLRKAPTPALPRPGCGRETLTTSGVCGEEMRPPQERAANENRMEFRDPRRNTRKGYSCVHGKVIIISAEVKHSGGSAFHLLRLGACEGGGAGGLSGGPGGSRFPGGARDREGLSELIAEWRGPSEPAASAPALRLLAPSPVLRKPFCQRHALSAGGSRVSGCTLPLQVPGQMERRRNEASGP